MVIKGVEIVIQQGDITECEVDAVVNAANNKFFMGGGVAGKIKNKGGKVIEDEAVSKGPAVVSEAVITGAGDLKANYVIHAVTMEMDFKTNEKIIRDATVNALLCARENSISSIAFCALGCGVGKFGYEAASKVMAQGVFNYLMEAKVSKLKKIIFVLYSKAAYDIFERNLIKYLEYIGKKISEGPFLTVDAIIEYNGAIVMIERSNPPFGWALPGGFVDYGESVEAAVVREVKEETSLDFVNIRQFKVCSEADRDPRFHTVSIVFFGEGVGEIRADSDAKSANLFNKDSLPEVVAFDHRDIISSYFSAKNGITN